MCHSLYGAIRMYIMILDATDDNLGRQSACPGRHAE